MRVKHRAEQDISGATRLKKPEQANKPEASVSAARPESKNAPRPDGQASVSPEDRAQMIARGAYFRAERRGFRPGRELDDWLESEAEIDRVLQDARP